VDGALLSGLWNQLLTTYSPCKVLMSKNLLKSTYSPRWAAILLRLSSIITVAVNWIVVEAVTSSWGFLWIVFAASAGIVWKIHKHFEVYELG
jgi:hypothetical protein